MTFSKKLETVKSIKLLNGGSFEVNELKVQQHNELIDEWQTVSVWKNQTKQWFDENSMNVRFGVVDGVPLHKVRFLAAKQSSTYGNRDDVSAKKAIDGNLDTSESHTDVEANPWWEGILSCRDTVQISKIKIYKKIDHLSHSNEGLVLTIYNGDFKQVFFHELPNSVHKTILNIHVPGHVKGSKVKIQRQFKSGDFLYHHLCLKQVEVYSQDTPEELQPLIFTLNHSYHTQGSNNWKEIGRSEVIRKSIVDPDSKFHIKLKWKDQAGSINSLGERRGKLRIRLVNGSQTYATKEFALTSFNTSTEEETLEFSNSLVKKCIEGCQFVVDIVVGRSLYGPYSLTIYNFELNAPAAFV